MNEPNDKTLVIVRHAHRDKDMGRDSNNGLSKKGKRQAEEILKYFEKRFPDEKPSLYSSPKKRCIETLEPLAQSLGTKVIREPLLDEMLDGESPEQFDKRISDFLKRWTDSQKKISVACSHGDWIPIFLQKISGSETDLSKGAVAEIVLKSDKETEIRKIIQSF